MTTRTSPLCPSLQLTIAAALAVLLSACGGSSSHRRACAAQQAEHPAYTTPARDAALCGNTYTAANYATACGPGFHVCRETEWHAIFPAGTDPGGDLTTWGAAQADRCTGGVWQADQPESDGTWNNDVCHDPYNPWNDGKLALSDDGTALLEGDGGCCGWDSSFDAADEGDLFAVYCCLN